MKRFVLVLFALAAVGTFSACKKDKKAEDTAADPAAKPADPAAGDPAKPEDKPADPAATDPAAATATPAGATDPAAAGAVEQTGVAECDALVKRQLECEKYPQAAKDAAKAGVKAWKDQAAASPEAAKSVADGCKKQAETVDAQLKAAGC